MKNAKLFLGIMMIILFAFSLYSFTGTGSGTEADPYIITTVAQLQEMKDALSAYYKLGNDIDASATSTWNSNGVGGYYGFEPIGVQAGSNYFKGGFDGDNHTISGLYINRPSTNDVGLFGYSGWESRYIKNVGLLNVNFIGGYRTGGLIARADTPIDNCLVTGSVSGSASNSVVGGFVAQSLDPINNCYARVDVISNYEAAGFVSFNNDAIQYCYSTGSVQQKTRDGGFAGNPVGHGSGSVENCFWDTQTSGQEDKMEDHVVIADICYNPGGGEYQYIAFYNPTSSAVDLDAWDFDDGNGYRNIGTSTNISANGFFLISVNGMNPTPDITTTLNLNTTTGTVKIRDGSDTEIDAVAYNSGSYPVYRRFSTCGGPFVYSNDYEPKNTSTVCIIDMNCKSTSDMKTLSTFTNASWDFEIETTNGTNDYWDMDISATINNGYPYLSWQDGDNVSLPVILSYFAVHIQENTPTIKWTTQSETNNLGWNIYRGFEENAFQNDNAFIVNPELIPSQGTSIQINKYEYIDDYRIAPNQTYWYWLESVSIVGETEIYGPSSISTPLPEKQTIYVIPQSFELSQNFPNPFNPTTEITFGLSEPANVSLIIYNVKGQIVETLIDNEFISRQTTIVKWNAKGNASGIYFYELKYGGSSIQKTMVLSK